MAYLLSWLILIPLIAAGIVLLVPSSQKSVIKSITLIATIAMAIFGCMLFFYFDGSLKPQSWDEAFQFVEQLPWINIALGDFSIRIDYYIGVDGISMPLVALTCILLVISCISSWYVKQKVKGYFALFLVLSASLIGCFVALDFFLFYVFFEFMLLPMFFLIGIWGGERRSYASVKFFIYTLLGSLFILIAMIGLYLSVQDSSGGHTFSMIQMLSGAYAPGSLLAPGNGSLILGLTFREWAFLLLLLGFLIKLPAVPFHTWLPDAHVEAPTAISVLLAGVLLKVGGYGLFRLCYGIFPDVAFDWAAYVAGLGVFAILYAGMVAMAQNDLKKLIAYSSVSHMGFVLLGLAALNGEGITGSLFQMISHGFVSGALFLIVGVVYDRTKDRQIENVSGLAAKLPVYTFFTVLFFFASLGLPGLSGFVGEVLVLMGAIGAEVSSKAFPKWIGMLAVLGIIISAAYYLWTLQRMFFGKYWVRESHWEAGMKDLHTRELLMLIPLAVFTVMFGIFPTLLLSPLENSIQFFVDHLLAARPLLTPQ